MEAGVAEAALATALVVAEVLVAVVIVIISPSLCCMMVEIDVQALRGVLLATSASTKPSRLTGEQRQQPLQH